MKNIFACAAITITLVGVSFCANAASKTVTLAIPTMDCPVCPITIKQALSKVPGVRQTNVRYDKRQAVVTFDDTQTNVKALTDSIKNAGFPSTILEAEQ